MIVQTLTFRNETSRPWTACVYQEISPARRYDSVAWLAGSAAPGESVVLQWQNTLAVILGEVRREDPPLYVPVDSAEADGGSIWRVVDAGGRQRLERVAAALLRNQVMIHNESRREASPGIALSGAPLLFQPSVPGGAVAQFLIHPTLVAGLFTRIREGEVVGAAAVGPLPLKFAPGVTAATLVASQRGATMTLSLEPGTITTA